MILTFLGVTDAMAIAMLDSYGLAGDISLAVFVATTVIGMPLLAYYMNRYHKKGF